MKTIRLTIVIPALFIFAIAAFAAGAPDGKQPTTPTSGSTASSGLQGLSFELASWNDKLRLPPLENRAVICYTLQYGHGAAQPFVLVPVVPNPDPKTTWDKQPVDWRRFYRWYPNDGRLIDPQEKKFYADNKHLDEPWTPCTILEKTSILMGQTLIVAIDFTDVAALTDSDASRMRVLNLNVTTSQGTPINPTPVRPSFTALAGVTQGGVPNPAILQKFAATINQTALNLAAEQTTEQTQKEDLRRLLLEPASQEQSQPPASQPGDNAPEVKLQKLIVDAEIRIVELGSQLAEQRTQLANWTATVNKRKQYFLTWPNALPGDTIPTVSVNGIYTVPSQGDARTTSTFYPVGSIVTPKVRNGHYYTALHSGISSNVDDLVFPISTIQQVQDGKISWVDAGPSVAIAGGSGGAGSKIPGVWQPAHLYMQGESIVDPYNGHVYVSLTPDNKLTPDINVTGALTPDPFSLPITTLPQTATPPDDVQEGSLTWNLSKSILPPACVNPWKSGAPYDASSAPVKAYNGGCYVAKAYGISGPPPVQPYFPASDVRTLKDGPTLIWLDLGVAQPAAVLGGQATDQTVSLLNLQLPQTHALSYYNLAAGVAYSTVHARSFGVPFGGSAGTTISTDKEFATSNSATVDPVLLLTVYPRPIDAETNCGKTCIITTTPGISFGLSLTNSATSFYAGFSFELLRNTQVVLAIMPRRKLGYQTLRRKFLAMQQRRSLRRSL